MSLRRFCRFLTFMTSTQAARTNLNSSVEIHHHEQIGEGQFRVAYAGTFVSGNRNQQEAVCKCFKDRYQHLEYEYFESDMAIADRAIELALSWNQSCEEGKEILITRGDVVKFGYEGKPYLVEPFIKYFTKFTSNNGWVDPDMGWQGEAMEAFTHYTYHKSGGSLIVCDLQGRYRHDRYKKDRCRFELTDTAICSRHRSYGPTDLAEKGIESFFARHHCNQFCHSFGGRWSSPRNRRQWFVATSGTSMISSTANHLLDTRNNTKFDASLQPLYEDDSQGDY
jgi:hypothetical protein